MTHTLFLLITAQKYTKCATYTNEYHNQTFEYVLLHKEQGEAVLCWRLLIILGNKPFSPGVR